MRRALAFRRSLLPFALGAIGWSQLGCATSNFVPAVPQGQTYEYDFQGFRASDTTVVAGGSSYGPSYAGVFAFRHPQEVHPEAGGKNPFEQSAVIDGYHFNMHLQGQGVRLAPAPGVPVYVPGASPSPSPVAPAAPSEKR